MATENKQPSRLGPSEQYSQASENRRYYGDMRFKQLSLYGVISTLILNAAISKQPQQELSAEHSNLAVFSFVGMAVTSVLWVMEIRSTVSELHYKHLAQSFELGSPSASIFPIRSVVLTATNAVAAFYAGCYLGWFLLWFSTGSKRLSEWALATIFLLLGARLLVYTTRQYLTAWQHWRSKIHTKPIPARD
jgi:hypothetical protein